MAVRHRSLPDITIPDKTGAFTNPDVAKPADPDPRNMRLRADRSTGSRVGKKCAPIWMQPDAKRQLDVMCLENDVTMQILLIEAVNLLFAKYGKPTIA